MTNREITTKNILYSETIIEVKHPFEIINWCLYTQQTNRIVPSSNLMFGIGLEYTA